MKKTVKMTAFLTAAVLAFTFGMPCAPAAEESTEAEGMVTENIPEGLILQDLDYTEEYIQECREHMRRQQERRERVKQKNKWRERFGKS